MRKRICPYCDQELEGRYCRGCRRFVKTPLIVDVNYYLNERHPASEESCQYHGDLHTGEMGGGPDRRAPYEDVEKAGWPGSKAAAAPKAKAGKNGRPGKKASEAPVSRNQSAGSGRSASRPGRGWAPVWILAAAAAAVIMASGGMVMNSISHMVPDLEPEPVDPEAGSWDEGISSEEVWPEETAAGEQELSEEEVRAAGIRCNGYGHLDVNGDDLQADLEGLAADHGLAVEELGRTSANFAFGEFTNYEVRYDYILTGEDGWYRAVTLSLDTGDGSLHGIQVSADNLEAMYQLLDMVMELLKESGAVSENPGGQMVFETVVMEGGLEDGITGEVMYQGLEAWAAYDDSGSGEFCMLSLYAPEEGETV